MDDKLKELFQVSTETLFSYSRSISDKKKKILCSPNRAACSCSSKSVSIDCKWKNIKKNNPNMLKNNETFEIAGYAQELEERGIERMFIPFGYSVENELNEIIETINCIKKNSEIEIFGMLGDVDRHILEILKESGMDGYMYGLESPNEKIYTKFNHGVDTFRQRVKSLEMAKEVGLKLWSGFVVGLGESNPDIQKGLEILKELDVDSILIRPFTPYPETEMWDETPANPLYWARIIAIARIYIEKPHLFSDQNDTFYGEYAKMAGVNGYFVFPQRGRI